MNVGDKVVVLPHSEYRGKYAREVGTIERVFNRSKAEASFGVRLDNFTHESNKLGLFWFSSNSINLENKFESEDNFMFNNFKVAQVSFMDKSTLYEYALYDNTIKEGDMVVVSTGHHGYAVAIITFISEDVDKRKEVMYGREVICKVDFSDFINRREAVTRAKELKSNMDKKIREAQNTLIYEMFAEKDPVLKEMLEEYKGIIEATK